MSTQGYVPVETPVRMIALEIDGRSVKVREDATILDAGCGNGRVTALSCIHSRYNTLDFYFPELLNFQVNLPLRI